MQESAAASKSHPHSGMQCYPGSHTTGRVRESMKGMCAGNKDIPQF